MDHKASAGVTDRILSDLLERHWEATMERHPTWASRLGDRRFDDRLPGTAPPDYDEAWEETCAFHEQAYDLEGATLSNSDQIALEVFREELDASLETGGGRFEEWSVEPRSTPFSQLSWIAQIRPFCSAADAGSLLERYRAMPESIRGRIECLRLGAGKGRYANRESLRRTVKACRAELARPVAEWAAVSAVGFADGVGEQEGTGIRTEAARVLEREVRPALAEFVDFLETELLPHGRDGDQIGLHALDRGEEHYEHVVRRYTSLDQGEETEGLRSFSPEYIHELGKESIEKLHAWFRELGEKVLGTPRLPEIFERLRNDPELHFLSAEEVEEKAVSALAAARDAIPNWFGRLPRADCVVKRIPAHEAPYTYVAYYRPPSGDGSQPGEYRINVHAPGTRPRYEAEALAFHESIPGHHLQIALAMEQSELPAIRRHASATAYVEGWALYTEGLADRMGLYSSDLDRLGMLSFNAWRSARLVVDTGIHAFGWTREQAIAYMVENTALATNNIDNEVDRYITWPGQALAYKIGQQCMLLVRNKALETLGDAFDIQAFHDRVLGLGPVPLGTLMHQMERWAEDQREGGTGG